MKNIIIPILTILVTFISIPSLQSQIIRDSTWHYEGYDAHPDWDLVGKTNYSYDAYARVVYETRYTFETNPISYEKNRTYSYDSEGRISQIDEYLWEDGTGWTIRYQYFYDYDSNSYLINDETWFHSPSGDIDKYRLEYSYDSEGNLLYEAYVSHSPGWGFVPETESNYTYDENNNLLSEYYIDGGGSDLTTYTYDDLNRRLSKLIQFYDYYGSGDLVDLSRETYYYTGDSMNKDSTLVESTGISNTEWGNIIFYTFDYTDSGLLEQMIRLNWEEPLEVFTHSTRNLYIYDANQNLIQRDIEGYSDNNEWEPSRRFLETFNNDNFSIEKYTRQIWDSDNLIWFGNDHEVREYDTDNNLKVEELRVWSDNLTEYENITKDVHFLSEFNITSIENEKGNTSCKLPNPYVIGTSFSCEKLDDNSVYSFHVHDLAGRQIYYRSFLGSQELRFQKNIPEGVYVFSITDKKGMNIYSDKIVVSN